MRSLALRQKVAVGLACACLVACVVWTVLVLPRDRLTGLSAVLAVAAIAAGLGAARVRSRVGVSAAFIVYLLSHDRPTFEVLSSKQKDISDEFLHGFEGMTEEAVTREELIAARAALVKEIVGNMPGEHRKFLLSFERGEPDWKLLGMPEAAKLPAVRWRQQNLDKLSKEKRAALVESLRKVLYG